MKTRMRSCPPLVVSAWLSLLVCLPAAAREEIALVWNHGLPQTEFAAKGIRLALKTKGEAAVLRYASAATSQYRPQLLTRIGYVDLNAMTESVQNDVAVAAARKLNQ